MSSAGPKYINSALTAGMLLFTASHLSPAACAAQRSDSGIRIFHRTPDEYCRGTARSFAVDQYRMKKDGVPIEKALAKNGGVALIVVITKAIYNQDLKSEARAADAGTAACLSYFR